MALRRIATGVLLMSSLIIGCSVTQSSTDPSLHADTYVGALPCADCAGIRNELTLYSEERSGRPVRYELKETYLGTRDGDRTFSSEGRWALLRGSANDQDAIVYQLDYDKPTKTRNFHKVSDEELRLLDREQKDISSSASHSLHRVAADSGGASVTLTERDAGRSIDVDVGSRVVIELQANRSTGYAWTLAPLENEVLAQLGEPTYATGAPANVVGAAGGTESWSFAARRSGESLLRFEYRRSWERDSAPHRRLSFTVNVR